VIILDASVLIAHLDGNDSHHDLAVGLLTRIGTQELAASALSLAEVLVGPTRAGFPDRALAALQQLGVTGIPINADSAVRLASLRAETGMKLPDCCVLLAAQESSAKLATFDARLAKIARDRGTSVEN